MSDITIRLRNFRAFDDGHPIELRFGPGFTALVGPNNSGKTSFLRLFYELRPLWNCARVRDGHFAAMCRGEYHPINIAGVHDPAEILCDATDRVTTIEFEFSLDDTPPPSGLPSVTYARFTNQTGNASAWTVTFEREHTPPAQLEPYILRGGDLFHKSKPIANYDLMLRHMGDLSDSLYIGAFRNAINEGSGQYYDLPVGTSFIETWNHWKTGPLKVANRAIEKITEDIRRIFGFKRLEITAAKELKTLQINVDGKPYKLSELGSGIAQFVIIYARTALQRPAYVFIDEPELNLHPSLQVDFLTSLAGYARTGIVFATHNLGLARATAERVYSFRRLPGHISCRLFNQTPNYAEFLGEMSFAGLQELGFDRILLVEGVTDVKTLQQFLRLFRKEHKVVVLPLGGAQFINGKVESELAELTRITHNVSVLIDSERATSGAPLAGDRAAFVGSCSALGFAVHVTERRAIENYLTDRAVKLEKGPNYSALTNHQLLKHADPAWAKHENWRIARHMTEAELAETDLAKLLGAL